MPEYNAPIRDVKFIINELLNLESFGHLEGFDLATPDMVEAIVDEGGRFCSDIIAPLNQIGDKTGCRLNADGSVSTPAGFSDAYKAYQEAGWGTLSLPTEFGGQGLPHVLHAAFEEFLVASNHAFAMYPGLTHGCVSAMLSHGSERLKELYLPKLVSGEWLGTMALTEPHAGTDLGLLRTKAEKQNDGSYSITGTKIFHSGGEQDLTENIVHLVLARLPDAPVGTKGLSLFLVSKFKLSDDGSMGERNAAVCGSIEEKMGIHGNATCVTNFDGAQGWIIGEENNGLAAMFLMMNAARLSVGAQGLGQAENAMQNAAAYARDRKQGRGATNRPDPDAVADPLIVHPDIRRMLMEARCFTEGMRALILWGALQVDLSHKAENEEEKARAEALVSFLTPVIKGFGSDRGFQTTVDMQQILGGHGYIAEYGMDQFVRDSRVAMIYEGANGVQALDLVGRKLARDGGKVASGFFALVAQECESAGEELAFIAVPLAQAAESGAETAKTLLASGRDNFDALASGSYAFMHLVGNIALGLMWLRMAKLSSQKLVSGEGDSGFYEAKLISARFYAEHQLPLVTALRAKAVAGSEAIMAMPAEMF